MGKEERKILEVSGITVGYGDLIVLRDLSLHVFTGEIVALLGPNGAGKTTLLRSLSGILPLRSGHITYEGAPLKGVPTPLRARRGLAHVPERRGIFAHLTVDENLVLGRPWGKKLNKHDLDQVFSVFPKLHERRNQVAGTLSGGEQQMLALGRALLSQPKLLLLDEPSLGLAPQKTLEMLAVIQALNTQQGLSVLLVEQNASLALKMANRGYVLEAGGLVASGLADDLFRDARLQSAYLGI